MYSTVTYPAPDVPAEKSIKIGTSEEPTSAHSSESAIVPVDPYLKTFAAVPAARPVNN
jgi:hypothetical protein